MRERLVIQTATPLTLTLASLVRSGTVATATTASAHGYATDDYVTLSGATPVGYNGKVKVTVTGATTFTCTVDGSLATPATGTIQALYTSDAEAGRRRAWTTIATVFAEDMPMRTSERLQLAAIQSGVTSRFRIYRRDDVLAKARALWTPTWPPQSAERTLRVVGVLPDPDDIRFMLLNCEEVAA